MNRSIVDEVFHQLRNGVDGLFRCVLDLLDGGRLPQHPHWHLDRVEALDHGVDVLLLVQAGCVEQGGLWHSHVPGGIQEVGNILRPECQMLRPFTASNCCYQGRRGSQKWYVSVCSIKKVVCCGYFSFFGRSSSINAFVADTQLCRAAIRTNPPCGVRYVACLVQVALLLSFLDPPWCRWCSDWCALGFSAAAAFGCVCLSRVSS